MSQVKRNVHKTRVYYVDTWCNLNIRFLQISGQEHVENKTLACPSHLKGVYKVGVAEILQAVCNAKYYRLMQVSVVKWVMLLFQRDAEMLCKYRHGLKCRRLLVVQVCGEGRGLLLHMGVPFLLLAQNVAKGLPLGIASIAIGGSVKGRVGFHVNCALTLHFALMYYVITCRTSMG